jgi:hypothetical protein
MSWKSVVAFAVALPLLAGGVAEARKKKSTKASKDPAKVAAPAGDGKAKVSESSRRDAEKRLAGYYSVVKHK